MIIIVNYNTKIITYFVLENFNLYVPIAKADIAKKTNPLLIGTHGGGQHCGPPPCGGGGQLCPCPQ